MSELSLDLAYFMATAGRSPVPENPDLTPYTDVANTMTRDLAEQGALRKLVQLSRVAKSVNRSRDKRHDDVKPYVQMHNKVASRMDLPDAPLPINAMDENGANKALALAVRENNPSRLRLLFAQGAIDPGGKVERTIPPGSLRDAFIAARKAGMNEWQRRARLPVNRVDVRGAKILLPTAVRSKDPDQVLRARALGAIDHGNLVLKGVPKDDQEMRAAVKKVAVLPTTTTDATTTATTTRTATTTTTQSTTTTTTTGTSQPRALMTRRARAPNNPNDG
ncbi:hypothetical protein [Hydrogenophaga sp. BPS33]|uniref:hypothetical protein n=1 Tax=Hydrogenophaga sp. BPS33 TaxID=2651974 RepID=UPI00131FD32D|nr:hypothetical protein [Hydrogenophaga sp. BPS33]QHE83974.1 hypothetical protein F9K07_03270 [Hydrogenophaga sp. BPS33]